MPKLYSFDVDETLEISNGPVKLQSMMDLRVAGHIVGICGNWGLFCSRVQGWHNLASFVNCCFVAQDQTGKIYGDKGWFLGQLKMYIPAEEYIHVGNRFGRVNSLGYTCGSHDEEAAQIAGYRFILEDDFAQGVR